MHVEHVEINKASFEQFIWVRSQEVGRDILKSKIIFIKHACKIT